MGSGPWLKAGASLLAAGVLAAIFLVGPPGGGRGDADEASQAASPSPVDRRRFAALLGPEIDSVLGAFGIDSVSVARRSRDAPGGDFTRTEWIVPLPDSVPTVSVNAALNAAARRRGGRAAASEDARFGTVTVHVEVAGSVVHTVILKRAPRRPGPDRRHARPAT